MSETNTSWIQRAGQWGLLSRAGLLLALFTLFLLMAAPLAWFFHGRAGLAAATLAAVICLIAGWLAMFATAWLAPPSQPAAHVLLGMMLRMGLPLILCMVILQNSTWLKEAGFGWFLVVAFSLGLAMETVLTVGHLQSNASYRFPTPRHGSRQPPLASPRPGGPAGSSGTSHRGETPPDQDPTLFRSV